MIPRAHVTTMGMDHGGKGREGEEREGRGGQGREWVAMDPTEFGRKLTPLFTTNIRLRFDGRSTAYQRSLRSQ